MGREVLVCGFINPRFSSSILWTLFLAIYNQRFNSKYTLKSIPDIIENSHNLSNARFFVALKLPDDAVFILLFCCVMVQLLMCWLNSDSYFLSFLSTSKITRYHWCMITTLKTIGYDKARWFEPFGKHTFKKREKKIILIYIKK